MNVAEYDQTLAEADRTLDEFVQHYRMLASEYGQSSEASNVTMLAEALEPTPSAGLAVLVAAAVRRLAAESGDGAICPRCGAQCSRDEVHNGVAMLYGPWGCACGWSESKDYDLTTGPKSDGPHRVDQWGGLTPGEGSA